MLDVRKIAARVDKFRQTEEQKGEKIEWQMH
jgi:hypothetical protein